MRQNHPKMGFGGILDRLEPISIPSISKEYKIKISTDFGSPGAPLALIGWQRAPLIGWQRIYRQKYPPPFWGKTTPLGAKLPDGLKAKLPPPFGAKLSVFDI